MSLFNSIIDGLLSGLGLFLLLKGFKLNLINILAYYVVSLPKIDFNVSLVVTSILFSLIIGFITFLVSKQ